MRKNHVRLAVAGAAAVVFAFASGCATASAVAPTTVAANEPVDLDSLVVPELHIEVRRPQSPQEAQAMLERQPTHVL